MLDIAVAALLDKSTVGFCPGLLRYVALALQLPEMQQQARCILSSLFVACYWQSVWLPVLFYK